MNKFQTEIANLVKVKKFLNDNEINSIMHNLATEHARYTGLTYTKSCVVLINMLNTIKQGPVVADTYTD